MRLYVGTQGFEYPSALLLKPPVSILLPPVQAAQRQKKSTKRPILWFRKFHQRLEIKISSNAPRQVWRKIRGFGLVTGHIKLFGNKENKYTVTP